MFIDSMIALACALAAVAVIRLFKLGQILFNLHESSTANRKNRVERARKKAQAPTRLISSLSPAAIQESQEREQKIAVLEAAEKRGDFTIHATDFQQVDNLTLYEIQEIFGRDDADDDPSDYFIE